MLTNVINTVVLVLFKSLVALIPEPQWSKGVSKAKNLLHRL